MNPRARLHERYDQLWSASIDRLRAGAPELDPVLQARRPDVRRGLTLVARPAPAVRRRLTAFLDSLRALEPEQYYYAPSEFHVTILSLFTATAEPEPFLARTEQYVAAVDAAWPGAVRLELEFTGVTASAGTVMIQGFFESRALDDLRDALRNQLQARGLAQAVDQRYRLETAHMTVVRFRAPLRAGDRLAATLEAARQQPFGTSRIARLALVKNDWYMSRHVVETLKYYP